MPAYIEHGTTLADLRDCPSQWAQNSADIAEKALVNIGRELGAVPGIPFADQPNCVRMAARAIVDDCRGEVHGYYNGRLQVALPNDLESRAALSAALRAMGLREVLGARYTFPLGTDNPPQHLRHRGYWLCTSYTA